MKKSLLFIVALPVIFACNRYTVRVELPEPFVLNGTEMSSNSPTVCLRDVYTGEILDSAFLDNGVSGSCSFTGKIEIPTVAKIELLYKEPLPGYLEYRQIVLIPLEKGTIVCRIEKDGDSRVSGSPVAEEYQAWNSQDWQGKSLDEIKGILASRFSDHKKEGALGPIAADILLSLVNDPAEADSLLAGADERIMAYPMIKKRIEQIRILARTGVGSVYTDVSGIDPLTGENVSLEKLLSEGRWAVLDFWGSWCMPCREAVPQLKKLAGKYGKQVDFIGIAINDNRKNCANTMERLGIEWPVLMQEDQRAAAAYGIHSVPGIVVLAGDGRIAARDLSLEELDVYLQENVE